MADGLVGLIAERVAASGPLTFAGYMRLALYHRTLGYYATRVPGAPGGRGADYGTSPSLSPWFGRLVARDLEEMWDRLGRPPAFRVVEVGAGQGDLAAAALDLAGARGGFGDALSWCIVERFGAVADMQRERLGPAAARVRWVADLGDVAPADGCVLAHEVLDNFPAHRFEVGHARVAEIFVVAGAQAGAPRLEERLGPPSSPELQSAAATIAAELEPGQRFEICPDLPAWCGQAAGALGRGFLLVVDYGDREPAIWQSNPEGSVATYGPGGPGTDPYADPGTQDITLDVNFSELERRVVPLGFRSDLFTTQREWLGSLGFGRVADALQQEADAGWDSGDPHRAIALEEELGLLRTLVAHVGLGDIMVYRASRL